MINDITSEWPERKRERNRHDVLGSEGFLVSVACAFIILRDLHCAWRTL